MSPVIATVILVAVAITVAVAVAYWMGGIASQYTKFEKVEIQTGVCTWNKSGTFGRPSRGQIVKRFNLSLSAFNGSFMRVGMNLVIRIISFSRLLLVVLLIG